MAKRKMPREFRDEAVEAALRAKAAGTASLTEVARGLRIATSTLCKWVREAEREKKPGGLTGAEREELARLRKENQRLRMEQEILKKAAAFFARESEKP